MRVTKVPPEISRKIRECRLSRSGLLRLLASLHADLPQQYDLHKRRRHPEDDRLFLFPGAFADGGLMHTFEFHIDDSTSAEHLLVSGLEHDTHPLGQ